MPEKKEVGLATYTQILDVNDAEELLTVDLCVFTHYLDPSYVKADNKAPDEFDLAEDYQGFLPKVTVDDTKERLNDEFVTTTWVNNNTGEVITSFYNTLTLKQRLSFYRFPLDSQMFSITLGSVNSSLVTWRADREVFNFAELKQGNGRKGPALGTTHVGKCELNQWNLTNVKVFQSTKGNIDGGTGNGVGFLGTEGKVIIGLVAERHPMYYWFSFCLIIYFIVSTNICVISIDVNQSGDRNAVSVTLLLTLVAFKFVLMQAVPRVGYMTYLDTYVIVGFSYIMAAIVENAAVSAIINEFARDSLDAVDELLENSTENVTDGFFQEALLDLFDNTQVVDFFFQLIFFGFWTLFNACVLFLFWMPNWIREPLDSVVSRKLNPIRGSVRGTKEVDYLEDWLKDEYTGCVKTFKNNFLPQFTNHQ